MGCHALIAVVVPGCSREHWVCWRGHSFTYILCPTCMAPAGAESRHKSLAVWEKLLCRQAAAVRAIRHRAAVSKTPGATGGASSGRRLLGGP
jgi:hypothetical protein